MANFAPTPPHAPVDTSGVSGDPGGTADNSNTASTASTAETTGPKGGTRVEPGPQPVTPFDTSATSGPNAGPHSPVSTAISGVFETTNYSEYAKHADPAYRPPVIGGVPAQTVDTTWTDRQPGGSVTNPVPTSNNHVNVETPNIGAAGTGTGVAPAAPGAAPTVASGPRYVTVTWVAVADPANDPVLEYVIENDRGGRDFAGRNETSTRQAFIDPSQLYRFRVAARNKAGVGPFSAWSDQVRPYNPDATDALAPGGLSPEVVAAGVYLPDGTFKPGTGGTNNAPVLGAITPGAAASRTVTVNWTAPTVGDAPTGYIIEASDGSTFNSGADTSEACVFDEAGASVTFTVRAVNAKGLGARSAPSAAVTVP